MSEHISRCYRCLAPNPAWGMTICAACRQVEALEKQTEEANSRFERESEQASQLAAMNAARMEEQNREMMRQSARNAELARQQAAENARLAAEGGVSYDDAYKYGFHYIETNGTASLQISLTEEGTISILRSFLFDPYTMGHLNQAFDRGLRDSIKDIEEPGSEFMIGSAYGAGLNTNSEFRINAAVFIGDYDVVTKKFDSKLQRHVDTETGYVTYRWDYPFKNKKMNESYAAGIQTAVDVENAEDKVAERLLTEVPAILAEQERAQKQQEILQQLHAEQLEINAQRAIEQYKQQVKDGKEALALFVILLVGIAFMVSMLWMVDHGFIAFVTLLGGAWLAAYQWWNDFTTDNLRKKYESGVFAKSMLE
jgi:hypothetical protein